MVTVTVRVMGIWQGLWLGLRLGLGAEIGSGLEIRSVALLTGGWVRVKVRIRARIRVQG